MMDGAAASASTPGGLHCSAAHGDASRASPASDLPEGFLPLRRVKALALQGRWPSLEDRMPPWLPFQCLVQMSKRENEGDPEAHTWLEIYRRAAQGDMRAQHEMGRAFETGEYGCEVDVNRAFFWYYRAGLAGDADATDAALRLKERFTISPAAMAEPSLVYAGLWRITRDDLDGEISSAVYELAESGSCDSEGRTGSWSYDCVHRTFTLSLAKPIRIRLIGCRETTLFGRDQHLVTYVIERAAPFKAMGRER